MDTATTNDRTHISVILDRTGSMEPIRADTIGGFNSFLAQHQALNAGTTFTLVQFDTRDPFEVLHGFVPIERVKPLTEETFVPRGGTPLNDAICRGIIDLDGRISALPAGERPSRVLFVIVTDGHENSSREFTGAQVRGMIDAHRKAGWQFVFLSADEAAVSNGREVNIEERFSASVPKSARGTRDLWRMASSRSSDFVSHAVCDMDMSELKAARIREMREEEERQAREAREARAKARAERAARAGQGGAPTGQ